MKKTLLILLTLVFIAGLAGTAFAAGDPNWKQHGEDATKAKALKAEGKYLAASEAHPYNLCKAWYLWNHACSLIGKRNSNKDWVYDASKNANNTEALKYLDEAERLMNDDDGFGCKGGDREALNRLIGLVRAEILKH